MEEPLNVKMYPTTDCKEVVDEIEKEYWGSNGINDATRKFNAWYVEKYNKDLDKILDTFDSISQALIVYGRKRHEHLVQKGTRFGVIYIDVNRHDFSLKIPAEYIQISPFGGTYAALNEKYKWGIPSAKWSVPFEFDDIIAPHNWFYIVKSNGLWGIYDSRTKEVNLSLEYDEIKEPTNNFYPVKYKGKWGLYYSNRKEMAIEPMYDDASIISEGLWAVKQDGKWGFVDFLNNIVVPFEYAWVDNYNNGYAHASKSEWMDYYDEALFENELLLDHQGRIVYFNNPEFYDNNNRQGIKIKKSFSEHMEYYYVVDRNDNVVIPQNKYRYIGKYSEGLFAASLDGETLGYIDIEENVIIPFDYQAERYHNGWDDTDSFHWGIVGVRTNRIKYSRECIIINQKNQKVFPYSFHCESLKYENGYFSNSWKIGEMFKKNNIGLIDIVNSNMGKDMSYLIKTEEEIEKDRERERRLREEEEPYQWTEEDAWDAMTDGMYGDYPGGDVDYERFGF